MPLFGRRKSKEPEEDAATAIVERALHASPLLQQPPPQTVAPFRREEVGLGLLLSSGEFSNDYAVLRLPLYDPNKSVSYRTLHKAEEEEARKRTCTLGTSLVAKRMNPKLTKQRKKLGRLYDHAAASLVLEAQYLARLSHPNIAKCRGQQLHHNHPTDFFFLKDRIVWTLAERIQKWKSGEEHYHLKCDVHHPVFPTKIRIARDVLSALEYLQDRHRIVLLNLSPNTIGFLEDGTVQLFDFGSCREIPPEEAPSNLHSSSNNEQAELTTGLSQEELSTENLSVLLGSTIVIPPFGSTKATAAPDEPRTGHCQTGEHRKVLPTAALGVVPRYLAPEVVTKGQYCLKSDSYSFCLIFYEMLTLSLPYAGYRPGQHMIKACIQGKRPNLQLYQFPKALENLLHKGWRHNWDKRIGVGTMKQVLSNDELFSSSSHKPNPRRRTVTLDSPPRDTTSGLPPSTRRSLMMGTQLRGGRRPSHHRKESPQHQSVGSNLHRMGTANGLFRRRQLSRQRSE